MAKQRGPRLARIWWGISRTPLKWSVFAQLLRSRELLGRFTKFKRDWIGLKIYRSKPNVVGLGTTVNVTKWVKVKFFDGYWCFIFSPILTVYNENRAKKTDILPIGDTSTYLPFWAFGEHILCQAHPKSRGHMRTNCKLWFCNIWCIHALKPDFLQDREKYPWILFKWLKS